MASWAALVFSGEPSLCSCDAGVDGLVAAGVPVCVQASNIKDSVPRTMLICFMNGSPDFGESRKACDKGQASREEVLKQQEPLVRDKLAPLSAFSDRPLAGQCPDARTREAVGLSRRTMQTTPTTTPVEKPALAPASAAERKPAAQPMKTELSTRTVPAAVSILCNSPGRKPNARDGDGFVAADERGAWYRRPGSRHLR